MKNYRVLPTVTYDQISRTLKLNRRGETVRNVFEDKIQLKLIFDNDIHDGLTFTYQVRDAVVNEMYTPYYWNECGVNLVVPVVQKNVNKELKKLVKLGILEEEKC